MSEDFDWGPDPSRHPSNYQEEWFQEWSSEQNDWLINKEWLEIHGDCPNWRELSKDETWLWPDSADGTWSTNVNSARRVLAWEKKHNDRIKNDIEYRIWFFNYLKDCAKWLKDDYSYEKEEL